MSRLHCCGSFAGLFYLGEPWKQDTVKLLRMLSVSGNDYAAAFVGSSASAFYGEMIARKVHAPATVFTVIAFVPLIPGASLYRAADALMNGHSGAGRRLAVYTLAFAACMSVGVVVTTLILRKIGKARAGRIAG